MSALRVALATSSALPDLDPDERLLLPALAALDVEAGPAVWDDEAVDWSSYDAVVVRSTWDYALRREEFLAWATRVEAVSTLLNPASLIAWNTDKHYLRDLASHGVPVVATSYVEPGDDLGAWVPPAEEFVVKPAVSAGSRDTARYAGGDRDALQLVGRLVGDGRSVMVQPYLADVDTRGETALIYLGGTFSHAIRKGPLLTRGGALVRGMYAEETITPRTPTAAEHAAAGEVLAALADLRPEVPLYTRVDLLADTGGDPVLLELELAEPSLFLEHDPGAAGRLAEAVVARAAG